MFRPTTPLGRATHSSIGGRPITVQPVLFRPWVIFSGIHANSGASSFRRRVTTYSHLGTTSMGSIGRGTRSLWNSRLTVTTGLANCHDGRRGSVRTGRYQAHGDLITCSLLVTQALLPPAMAPVGVLLLKLLLLVFDLVLDRLVPHVLLLMLHGDHDGGRRWC